MSSSSPTFYFPGCSCGRDDITDVLCIQCQCCRKWYHSTCLPSYLHLEDVPKFIRNYKFLCSKCTAPEELFFERTKASWISIGVTALANLTYNSMRTGENRVKFNWRDITNYMQENWGKLWAGKVQTDNWKQIAQTQIGFYPALIEKTDVINRPYSYKLNTQSEDVWSPYTPPAQNSIRKQFKQRKRLHKRAKKAHVTQENNDNEDNEDNEDNASYEDNEDNGGGAAAAADVITSPSTRRNSRNDDDPSSSYALPNLPSINSTSFSSSSSSSAAAAAASSSSSNPQQQPALSLSAALHKIAGAIERGLWKEVLADVGGMDKLIAFVLRVLQAHGGDPASKGEAAKVIGALISAKPPGAIQAISNVNDKSPVLRGLTLLLDNGNDTDREHVAWAIGMMCMQCEGYAASIVETDPDLGKRIIKMFSCDSDDAKLKAIWAARWILDTEENFGKMLVESGLVFDRLVYMVIHCRRQAIKGHASYIIGSLLSKYPSYAVGLDTAPLIHEFCNSLKCNDANLQGDVLNAIADLAPRGFFKYLTPDFLNDLASRTACILKESPSNKTEAAFAIAELSSNVPAFAVQITMREGQLAEMLIKLMAQHNCLSGIYSVLALKSLSQHCEDFRQKIVSNKDTMRLLAKNLCTFYDTAIVEYEKEAVRAMAEMPEVFAGLGEMVKTADPRMKTKLQDQLANHGEETDDEDDDDSQGNAGEFIRKAIRGLEDGHQRLNGYASDADFGRIEDMEPEMSFPVARRENLMRLSGGGDVVDPRRHHQQAQQGFPLPNLDHGDASRNGGNKRPATSSPSNAASSSTKKYRAMENLNEKVEGTILATTEDNRYVIHWRGKFYELKEVNFLQSI